MKKVNEFSKVLDSLNNDGKDKLITSAEGLMKAQKVVRAKSKKPKTTKAKKDV